MPQVLIIQAEVKHYRLPFYVGLQETLQRSGIELVVAYSRSNSVQSLRKDSAEVPSPWGRLVRGHWFFNRFIYQNLWKDIFKADLVIIGPEIKFVNNPVLLLLSAFGLKRVAFWGLGPNRHPDRSDFAEWLKRPLFTCVDWWFAYTRSIADYLQKEGMPAEKITNVQNATDSAELRRLLADISSQEAAAAKATLTKSEDSKVGFYCGMLGQIKEIPFLIQTARLVKEHYPEFHLVIIGNGPDRPWLEKEVANDDWIHYLGSKFGRESALYYKMADVFLLAGTAGLAVVDSFAAELPLIATDIPTHPPEISYVVDGENGRLAKHDPSSFANSIVEVLSQPDVMDQLRRGARNSANQYTIEAMVDNFGSGIKRCLAFYGLASSIKEETLSVSEANKQRL